MSKFFTSDLSALKPYVPGEQPKDKKYIKLNTNESPFPPSPEAIKALGTEEALCLNLYPDPDSGVLCEALAERYGVSKENIMCTNSSDEALAFTFRAFCGSDRGAAFSDITYGFYPVYCNLYGIKSRILPLKNDFTINADDYIGIPETVFIANPNAQTGISLPVCEIERIISSDPGRVVVVDEAYVDFGGESSVKLISKYRNLIIVSTFSKSRSFAGGRLGFIIADKELITDLNTVRYSFNPYNVNRLTMAAATAAVKDVSYYAERVKEIVRVRAETREALVERGFYVTDSKANFLLAGYKGISGQKLYSSLREMGILVRILPDERIKDFIRVTIGSGEQMKKFVACIDVILKETVVSGGKL